MSYSFSLRAATKAEAKEKIAVQMATIVEQQPVHAKDVDQAKATANAFVDMLQDDESRDVMVHMNGSVGWTGDLGTESCLISSAGVGVSASLTTKEAPKAAS